MMAFCVRRECYETIDEAKSVNDLIPMLNKINLEKLKECIADEISTSDCRQFYDGLSIDKILPKDVLKHVLSFSHGVNIGIVSKLFSTIYNQLDRKWIVDQNGKIHDHVFNNLNEAIDAAQNGDKICVHNGIYSFPDNLNKNIKIIGIGDFVVIRCNHIPSNTEEDRFGDHHIYGNIYFKNMTFSFGCTGITVHNALYIDNCNINFIFEAIKIKQNGKLNASNTMFMGNDYEVSYQAIETEGFANVYISNCQFIGCGRNEGFECILFSDNSGNVQFKSIGNVFQNNGGNPIGFQY